MQPTAGVFAAPHFHSLSSPRVDLYPGSACVKMSAALPPSFLILSLPTMEHNIYLFCLRPYALLIKSTLSFASSLSWSLQRAATLMEDLSARRATRSCPLRWREQGASGTHAHLPSSKTADCCLSYMHNYTHTHDTAM